jgi:hypothetical protein
MAVKTKAKVEPVQSFSFDNVQKVEPKAKGKAPTYPTIPCPPEHVDGMRDYLAAKKLAAEAEALEKGKPVAELKAYAYDLWLTKGVTGSFSSSLKFSSSFGDMLYISAKMWKKINTEEDAQYLRDKLGEENFNEMVNKTTTLTGDLAEVETKFNDLVRSGKIDAKTAKTMFEFIVSTFRKDVAYEFKKDVLDWHDVFALAGGDKDTAIKVMDTTLGRRPYFREA